MARISISISLCLWLSLATPLLAGSAFRRGDVNADGAIDISDPVSLLLSLFAGAAPPGCLAGGNIRHMYFHAPAREIWFGTDTNTIGRARVE